MAKDGMTETGQESGRKKLGNILMEAGLIESEQLKQALQKQSVSGKRIGNILVEMGFVSEENLVGALSKQLGFPSIDLKKARVSPQDLKLLPPGFLMRHQAVPVEKDGNILRMAMTNPLDLSTINDIEFLTGQKVQPLIAASSAMEHFLSDHIAPSKKSASEAAGIADRIEVVEEEVEKADLIKLKHAAESQATQKAVNRLLADAMRSGATVIHIKPRQNDVLVRYRIDGLLRNVSTIQGQMFPAILARLKIFSRMDIGVTRRPQSGNVTVKIGERVVELRISTTTTMFGEKVVIRLLEKSQEIRNLENLGMHPKDLSLYYSLLARPHGIIMVIGPVGSGTSTTLYTTLRYLRSEESSIITVEDPVEFLIPGINQIQVDPRENISFISALRSVQHQDPDIIMVSEIRDTETAHLVFQSALRGYRVLASLYNNHAVSALTYLMNLEDRPQMVASALGAVVAQRLVRRNCPHCLEKYIPEPRVLAGLNIDVMEVSKMRFFRGRGCDRCRGTGYSGQIGIFEILSVDHIIKDMILQRSSEMEIMSAARKKGMTTMEENGLYLVLNKVTTLEEILRVVPPNVLSVTRRGAWEKQIISLFDDAIYIL